MTDAQVIHRRVLNWGKGGIPLRDLRHQMGGRAGVDPYGWSDKRIDEALIAAIDTGLVTGVETITGWAIKAVQP